MLSRWQREQGRTSEQRLLARWQLVQAFRTCFRFVRPVLASIRELVRGSPSNDSELTPGTVGDVDEDLVAGLVAVPGPCSAP